MLAKFINVTCDKTNVKKIYLKSLTLQKHKQLFDVKETNEQSQKPSSIRWNQQTNKKELRTYTSIAILSTNYKLFGGIKANQMTLQRDEHESPQTKQIANALIRKIRPIKYVKTLVILNTGWTTLIHIRETYMGKPRHYDRWSSIRPSIENRRKNTTEEITEYTKKYNWEKVQHS